MASCSANPVPATLAGRRLPAADDNQGGGHRNRCNYEDRQERWAIGLMEGRTNHGPANMTLHNAVLGCLRGASFSMEMTVHAYSMQDAYIYGFALQEMDMSSVSAEDFAAEAQRQMHEYQALLDDYPHAAEVVGGHIAKVGYDYTTEFLFGLDLILESLDKLRHA